ncbi:MAG: MBOAT family protein, partial [Prolixibacteraceae bacterium]|nr:MBOAT family protein [Prolixibacteraceae bacterium]
MVFSSIIFLLYFFPAFLLVYYLVPSKAKNLLFLIFSIVFYAWGAPDFVFILLGSTLVNFYVVKAMYFSNSRIRKKSFAAISVFLNLGLLAYFKYANFFIENVNEILGLMGLHAVNWTGVVLPIGISFFTFQSLTYTIDTYRKINAPLKNPLHYVLYIIMFPQLIAGPIVRFQTIAGEIVDRKETYEDRLLGFYRFVIGLAKKVLIADVLGSRVDYVMSLDYSMVDATTAWVGILSYAFQIYFDFSGYSDMAIGMGRMLGFRFPENFDNPYISKSITEFWRRWHMTFTAFMRYYLYYPLGGNRVETRRRLYFNLMFVFLVSGLWHGASWNFVIWGAIHGLFLILERLFLSNWIKRIGKISIFYSFFVVLISWVPFRVEGFDQTQLFLASMFSFNWGGLELSSDWHFYFILA